MHVCRRRSPLLRTRFVLKGLGTQRAPRHGREDHGGVANEAHDSVTRVYPGSGRPEANSPTSCLSDCISCGVEYNGELEYRGFSLGLLGVQPLLRWRAVPFYRSSGPLSYRREGLPHSSDWCTDLQITRVRGLGLDRQGFGPWQVRGTC